MSAVIILVPVLTGVSWTAIGAAVAGVAASLGFGLAGADVKEISQSVRESLKDAKSASRGGGGAQSAEVALENTELSAEELAQIREFTMVQGNIKVHLRRRADGACVVCADGPGRSKAELEAVAKKVSQRLVQQLIYNKIVTELKGNDFEILDQNVDDEHRIRIRVSRWT